MVVCAVCGKEFELLNPYLAKGEGACKSFVNLKRFHNKEIETIWDIVPLCGSCYGKWKNRRTKIRQTYPATLREAEKGKNNKIYRCSKCGKVGHNVLTCPKEQQNKMMNISEKQRERQKYRDKNGKYAEMLRCEECGKKVGLDYYSREDCNKTGKGLTLCKKCYENTPQRGSKK